MESKDRKSARPSLFETAPAPAAQGEARASQGKVDLGLSGSGGAPRRVRRIWPAVLVVGMVAAGLAGWAILSNRGNVTPPMQASTEGAAGTAADASPAVLVGGGLAHAGRTPADDPLSIFRTDAGAQGDPDADAGTAGAGEGSSDLASRFGLESPAGAGASATREPAATGTRRAKRSGASASSDKTDLLAILMANIREKPENAADDAAPRTMDDLIAQLSATSASGPAPTATADRGTTDQSSANLQRQLRSCPAANTTAGIRCRQRLCARHAGDPACPTQQD